MMHQSLGTDFLVVRFISSVDYISGNKNSPFRQSEICSSDVNSTSSHLCFYKLPSLTPASITYVITTLLFSLFSWYYYCATYSLFFSIYILLYQFNIYIQYHTILYHDNRI